MLPTNLVRIIDYLVRNALDKFNVNQLARNLKISVGSAHKTAKSLHKSGILVAQKMGNGIYYALNFDNKEAQKVAELALMERRKKYFAGNPHASVYAQDLQGAAKFSKAAILFGSILTGKDANDVDVLFIINKGKVKAVEDFCIKLSNLSPKRVNPLSMTAADFKRNIEKQDEIVAEVLKKGAIVFGEDEIIKILGNAELLTN